MATQVPSDLYLIQLYREFSQECWLSPWIGNPAPDIVLINQFTNWIANRTDYKPLAPRDFEIDALPTLRSCFLEAAETIAAKQNRTS